MSITARKLFWWITLSTCIVIGFMFSAMLCFPTRHFFSTNSVFEWCALLSECILAGIAICKLKRYYAEESQRNAQHWQISLSDLLSIVFFFAIAMSTLWAINPERFLYSGLLISTMLGVAYFVALLVLIRNATFPHNGLERWLNASLAAIGALVLILAGVFVQIMILILIRAAL